MTDGKDSKPAENSLAARIIKEREKRRWTQKNLVEKTGLRPQVVYEVEKGEAPTVEALERFAKAFGMYVEDLTRGVERDRFTAPLGKPVRLTVVIYTIAMIATAFFPFWEMTAFLFLLYIGCLLYSIQGFAIDNGTLIVKRLLWKTKIPLTGLVSATADKTAMKGSLRFGNGGLFAYTGIYKNATTGRFRAYATDCDRAVVLRFANRTIVVTPDDPDAFVRAAQGTIKQ